MTAPTVFIHIYSVRLDTEICEFMKLEKFLLQNFTNTSCTALFPRDHVTFLNSSKCKK